MDFTNLRLCSYRICIHDTDNVYRKCALLDNYKNANDYRYLISNVSLIKFTYCYRGELINFVKYLNLNVEILLTSGFLHQRYIYVKKKLYIHFIFDTFLFLFFPP